MGAVRASFIPTVTLTTDAEYRVHPGIPIEYQPRIVDSDDREGLQHTLETEIGLYEEEFVSVEDSEELEKYVELLVQYASPLGRYDTSTHNVFVQEMTMTEDHYHFEQSQIGAVGRGARAKDMTFHQTWNQSSDEIGDLNVLAEELARLRAVLKEQAQTAEQDSAIGEVVTPCGSTAASKRKPSYHPMLLDHPMSDCPASHPCPRRLASRTGIAELSRAS